MRRDDAAVLRVRRLDPGARLPTRAHPGDAGLDLHSLEEVRLGPGEGKVLRTGIAVAVPHGHVGMIADRSSLARRGIKVAGGIVDCGYRGEVGVVLWNLSGEAAVFSPGDRIAQLLTLPVSLPEALEAEALEDDTSRGRGGFGSSGR